MQIIQGILAYIYNILHHNPTFKRDKEGNEILVPDTNSVLVLGSTGEGDRTVSHEQKRKVEDDQTPDVPVIFAEWKVKEGLAW